MVPLLPSTHCNNPRKTCAATFFNMCLLTSSWKQIAVNSQDIVAASITMTAGTIMIFNLYNDRAHSDNLQAIQDALVEDAQNSCSIDPTKRIWIGDLNHHHQLWDKDWNLHLFTTNNLADLQLLLDLLAEYNMVMLLPKDIPMLQVTCTKNLTRPDNVFTSDTISHLITQYKVHPDL